MTKRFSEDYLRDIDQAIEDVISFIKDMTFTEFEQDKRTIYATVRAIQIIGEAVKKVPQSIKDDYSYIPWQDIAGIRDKVTHQYFAIKLNVIWETVKNDLPILQESIKEILTNFNE